MRGRPPITQHEGFSLVEVMVGMAIGLLATLVIVQVYTTFSAQQHKTAGSADAQTSGGLATYLIQREAQLGGYGLPVFDTTNPALQCSNVNLVSGATTTAMDISPISLVDGGAAADQIIVHYADSQLGGISSGSISYSADSLGAFTTYFLPYLYVTGPGNCPVTMSDCTSPQYLMVAAGGNCTVSPISATQSITITNTDSLAYLGGWNAVTFRVNGNQLERDGVPVAPDVVDMQAQYGVSAVANSNVITQWVDAAGATWATPSVADRNRIKAIHIAVVTRNGQREGSDVTSACSSLTAANPTGLCAWAGTAASPAPAINLTDANWRKYHYRVFDTIIPLRNVIWSQNTMP